MLPASNSALLTYPFQVLSREQSLPGEITTPGRVKRETLQRSCEQEAPFPFNRRKHRKIVTIDLTGSDHDEGALFEFTRSFTQLNSVVTDHLPAHRDEFEVRVNDGRDVEHVIEIGD